MKIDLGEKIGGEGLVASAPLPLKSDKYYPSIYIKRDEPLDLPSEGTMTVTFKRRSEEVRTDEEGNTTYSCCIEIKEILEVDEAEPNDLPKNRGKATEDALDALVAAHKANKSKESY